MSDRSLFPILFITRKWQGHGGMQRLARDLWKGMEEHYADEARLCAMSSPLFFPRILLWGIAATRAGCHIHLLDAMLAPLGWLFKKIGKGKVTVTVCGLDVIWKPWWYQWLMRRTLPTLDRIVCISRATAEEVKRRGVSEEKIRVIPCGVWPLNKERREVKEIQGNTILLSVCRLVPRKGIAWFTGEVLPLLLQNLPRLQYFIVGSGPEEKLIKKIVQEKGFDEHVFIYGEIPDRQRDELFSCADLVIVPNISREGDMEGFGISCIEASLRGIPVIAARLEGLQDAVVEGLTGEFFHREDAEDCVRIVRKIIREREENGMWSPVRLSQATLEHYEWSKLMWRYRDEVFGF